MVYLADTMTFLTKITAKCRTIRLGVRVDQDSNIQILPDGITRPLDTSAYYSAQK